MSFVNLYFGLKIGIPLFLFTLAVVVFIMFFIVESFKVKFYKDCNKCINYKFYDTLSVGDGIKYRCDITKRIDVIKSNRQFVPIKKCEHYNEKEK